MRRVSRAAGVAAAIGLVFGFGVPAFGAELSNGSGQGCPSGTIGTYHFVNNQDGGATTGILTATFSDGSIYTVGPSLVNKSTMHFDVTAAGDLTGASTGSLPGKLVLSDFSCTAVKKK